MAHTLLEEITAYLHAELASIDGLSLEDIACLIVLASNYARGLNRGLSNGTIRLASAIPHLRSEIANDPALTGSNLPQHSINRATAAIERVVLLLLGNVQ